MENDNKINVNFEIFPGKKFCDLVKDIVTNSENNKKQINNLIEQLRPLVKTVNDAMIIVPLIKEYYEVEIKNDEQLTKIASVIQRLFSSSERSEGSTNEFGLTDDERDELLKEINIIKKDGESVIPIKKVSNYTPRESNV